MRPTPSSVSLHGSEVVRGLRATANALPNSERQQASSRVCVAISGPDTLHVPCRRTGHAVGIFCREASPFPVHKAFALATTSDRASDCIDPWQNGLLLPSQSAYPLEQSLAMRNLLRPIGAKSLNLPRPWEPRNNGPEPHAIEMLTRVKLTSSFRPGWLPTEPAGYPGPRLAQCVSLYLCVRVYVAL